LQSLDLSHCIHCRHIGLEAFHSCGQLSFIQLPPNLNSIRHMAISDCPMLTHVRLPPFVESIGFEGGPIANCRSLVSLEVSEDSIDIFRDSRIRSIAGCPSLVNLHLQMPPGRFFEDLQLYNNFPQDFQFAEVATGWEDLRTKLHHRFVGLDLHKGCYFHSYHPIEGTIEKIRNLLELNPSAANDVDALGMTPLHILSLAQKPMVELLQELPTVVKMALTSKDSFGSTPLDYLCKNPLREGMHTTRWMIRKILEGRLPFLGLDQWKQELLEAEERVRSAADTRTMSDGLRYLVDKLGRLELLEALSLLELVLWRTKLLEENKNKMMMVEGDAKKARTDRESCRVQCGISIVVANVLPFLGKE